MVAVLKRIIISKKSVLATLGLAVNMLAVWGFDVPKEQLTEGVLGIFNALDGLLIASQALIDAVHGSPSDKNGS